MELETSIVKHKFSYRENNSCDIKRQTTIGEADIERNPSMTKRQTRNSDSRRKNPDNPECFHYICCCSKQHCLTLLSCFVLHGCSSFFVNLIDSDLETIGFKKDWGEGAGRSIQLTYCGFRLIATLLAALLSLKIGCRLVAAGGCVLLAVSSFISTWLNHRLIGIIGFQIGVVAGTASSFIKLASIVPILENFRTYRFFAVAFVNVGDITGDVAYYNLVAFGVLRDVKWKLMFRWQLAVVAVAFLASLGLRSSDKNWISKYFVPFDWKVFKRRTLYILLAAVFFSRFGHYHLSRQIIHHFDGGMLPLTGVILYFSGQIIGPVILLCCFRRNFLPALVSLYSISFVLGIWTMIIGFYTGHRATCTITNSLAGVSMTGLCFPFYGALLGISKASFDTLVQNGIPTAFGVKHVRLVFGLLDSAAGLGILMSVPINQAAEGRLHGEYSALFIFSGVTITLSSIVTAICVYVVMKIEPLQPENDMWSSADEEINEDEINMNKAVKTRQKHDSMRETCIF